MGEILLWVTAGVMLFVGLTNRFSWDAKWRILTVLLLNTISIRLAIIADLLR